MAEGGVRLAVALGKASPMVWAERVGARVLPNERIPSYRRVAASCEARVWATRAGRQGVLRRSILEDRHTVFEALEEGLHPGK